MQKSDPLGTVSSDVEVCFFQYSQLYQYLLLSRQPFWISLDYRWSALLYVQRCLKFFNVPEWTQNIIAEMSNTSKIIFELSSTGNAAVYGNRHCVCLLAKNSLDWRETELYKQ